MLAQTAPEGVATVAVHASVAWAPACGTAEPREMTPGVFRELGEWLRHRLQVVQLKQWKRGDNFSNRRIRTRTSSGVGRD